MMRPWNVGVANLGLAAICACASDDRGSTEVQIRDSAGIRIVATPDWTTDGNMNVPDSSTVTIGVTESSEYELSGIVGAFLLSDGRIVVGDAATRQVRCYSSSGTLLWSLGRRGSGPGEFNSILRIARYRGDSILVHDFGARRFSIVSPAGAFARYWTPAKPASVQDKMLQFVGAWSDGTVVLKTSPIHRPREDPRVVRIDIEILSFDPTGSFAKTLGVFRGEEWYEGRGFGIGRLPFSRSTQFALSDGGFVAGATDEFEITDFTRDGHPRSITRRLSRARPISPSDVRNTRTRLLEEKRKARDLMYRGLPDSIRQQIDVGENRMVEEMPFPPTYPTFSRLLVSLDQSVWVRNELSASSASSETWSVFDKGGMLTEHLRLPPGDSLQDATRTEVLVISTDSMGLQAVRLLPRQLAKRPP